MTEEQFQKIIEQLASHEKRLNILENSSNSQAVSVNTGKGYEKQLTLREIVSGRKFKNGQEGIAIIVGYHEKVVKSLLHEDNIKTEWTNAKITNKYSTTYLGRAKDKLIRVNSDGICDLTKTGEEFFGNFFKNESTDSTSK